MDKGWVWSRLDNGSIAVYYNDDLYWELDGLEGCSEAEINLAVKEFIMANQHMLHDE